jgi:hypothetical protein
MVLNLTFLLSGIWTQTSRDCRLEFEILCFLAEVISGLQAYLSSQLGEAAARHARQLSGTSRGTIKDEKVILSLINMTRLSLCRWYQGTYICTFLLYLSELRSKEEF